MERLRARLPFDDDLPGSPFLVAVEESAPLVPPEGCRLERWEYPEGTPRIGLICASCGAALDPAENLLSAIRQEHLVAAHADHVCRARSAGLPGQLASLWDRRRKLH
jgi:hypothetical protein